MVVFSCIEGWYNPGRHSGVGYLSPIAYEIQMTNETETPKPQPPAEPGPAPRTQ
jgi:hypothetical protein